jgi:hypothetical protein
MSRNVASNDYYQVAIKYFDVRNHASGGQEGPFMTRDELQTSQDYMWRALFGEQRTTLALAVEMLLRCHLSPEQILTKTMTALEGSQQDS